MTLLIHDRKHTALLLTRVCFVARHLPHIFLFLITQENCRSCAPLKLDWKDGMKKTLPDRTHDNTKNLLSLHSLSVSVMGIVSLVLEGSIYYRDESFGVGTFEPQWQGVSRWRKGGQWAGLERWKHLWILSHKSRDSFKKAVWCFSWVNGTQISEVCLSLHYSQVYSTWSTPHARSVSIAHVQTSLQSWWKHRTV